MLREVLTGGQSGVDQAAWRAARSAGLRTGGRMPREFLTEDGPRPEFASGFGAVAIESEDVDDRTRANVDASDASLVFLDDGSGPGTRLSAAYARERGKPLLVESPEECDDPDLTGRIARWLAGHRVAVLNVAGDRESTRPGIGARIEPVLAAAFVRAITSGVG